MFVDFKSLLIEFIDLIVSSIVIGFILIKFAQPWAFLIIGILVLPFAIGVIRLIKNKR
jgi:F0F1-type ATP synthase assembly protein I